VPLRRKPLVTNALVWINIIILILTRHSGHFEEILLEFGYTAVDDRLLTLFTHMFLHGGYLHVLVNMLFLWIFGANVEDRMGRLGFLLFYLASGVAAAYVFAYTSGPALSGMPLVGASGAVYGVMGAFLMLYPLEEIRFTIVVMVLVLFWRFYTIPIAALFIAPLYFLSNLLLSPVRDVLTVAVMAHIGGFLFAVPVGLLHRWLHPGPKRPPAPEIHLEEPAAKPQTEQERIVHDIREALLIRDRTLAIGLYREAEARFESLPLSAVDLLLLAEIMSEGEEYRSAAEVYRRIGREKDAEESLRIKAAIELGRLYLEHFGDVPRGIKIYRRLLEKFPSAPQSKDVRRMLSELELKGYPPHCEE
jgi:membrane associated rhomboid family serine protease